MKYLLILLLTACAPITPSMCREVGVYVPRGAIMTGHIEKMNVADAQKVRAHCQSPFTEKQGCALAVYPGEYVIWAIDDARVIVHEECHALYEAGHL